MICTAPTRSFPGCPARMRPGSMMIELLIGCVIALLTGAALVSLQQSSYVASSVTQGQSLANTQARQPLDILGDTLRNAQIPTGSTSAISAAAASDVTCYTDPNLSGSTTRIWRDANSNLQRSKTDSSGTTTTTLLTGVQTLTITYYMPAAMAYNADTASWTTTADPNAPTAAELPGVGAVSILATITVNGETRTLQSFVRMRNSPNTHET